MLGRVTKVGESFSNNKCDEYSHLHTVHHFQIFMKYHVFVVFIPVFLVGINFILLKQCQLFPEQWPYEISSLHKKNEVNQRLFHAHGLVT